MTAKWRERPEVGSPLALRLILLIAFRGGRTCARVLVRASAAYFLMRRAPERRASLEFLTLALGRPARLRDAYRHLLCFSQVVLDRLYLVSERFQRFDIHCFGLCDLDRALVGGQGVLLVGAHLGSFEALRILSLQRPDVPIRILLDQEQGPAISRTLNALNPKLAATIIDTRAAGPTVALTIKRALADNAIVALLADRALPGGATRAVRFMGRSTPLPVGPWLLAAALNVPVVLAFGLYRGANRYDLHFETFAERVAIDRNHREVLLSQILQDFADRLAHYAQLAPYNWFNFYAFWNEPADGDRVTGGSGALPRST